MKRIVLIVAMMVTGCEQSQVVGQCGDGERIAEAGSPFLNNDAGHGGNGGAGGEGGGPMGPYPAGASCSDNADCIDLACIPSQNSFGTGVCYAPSLEGCIVVTDPSPFKAQCASLSQRLYTCGDSYDVTLLGNCTNIGDGSFGETYHCCFK